MGRRGGGGGGRSPEINFHTLELLVYREVKDGLKARHLGEL